MTTEERLEKLEKELVNAKRRNRWMLGLLGFAALAVIVSGPCNKPATGTIRAREIVVVDTDGKPRVGLGVTKDGPRVGLYDENQKVRVGLRVLKDVPMLSLYDENGNDRAWLVVDKNGAGLDLSDEKGKVRAGLNVLKGRPGLSMRDENGKTLWTAP